MTVEKVSQEGLIKPCGVSYYGHGGGEPPHLQKKTMNKQQATNEFINRCLDVNCSWVDSFNEIGLLATMDLDIDQGWTIIGDGVRENLVEQGLTDEDERISDSEVDDLIYGFITEYNYKMTKEMILMDEDWSREVVLGCGADEDYFDEWMEEKGGD